MTTFALAEACLALIFAWRSRFTRPRTTWVAWGAHLGMALVVWQAPASGPWASVMRSPAPVTMLTVATASLALLLFTANFFHGVAKPEKDAETYFGVVLDTYLSRRSWFTTLLLAPTFHAMVVALFTIPIILPTLQRWAPAVVNATAAAWIAAVGLVFTVLLLNALSVLRTSLMRLVRRQVIRRRILDETSTAFLHDAVGLLHQSDTSYVRETVNRHLVAMAAMPPDQQVDFMSFTVAHGKIDSELDSRCHTARALTSGRKTARLHVLEAMHGNRGTVQEQARSIMTTVLQFERERASALAACYSRLRTPEPDHPIAPDIGDRILDQLTGMAMAMHRRWESLQTTDLAACWLRPHQRLDEHSTLPAASWRGTKAPDVLEPVTAILERVIDLRFPRDRPTSCSSETLSDLGFILGRIRHDKTRLWLMTTYADALIRCTVTDRDPDESLPISAARDRFGLDRTRPDEDSDMQCALKNAAFSASRSDPMPEPARSELLLCLTTTQVLASLLHALMYRYRSHKDADATLLRPYAQRLRSAYPDPPHGIDPDELCELGTSDIAYFVTPDDVGWLLTSLELPADTDLVSRHLRYQHQTTSWLRLEALLAWRGTVKDIEYSWKDPDAEPVLPTPWTADPTQSLLAIARLLDEVVDGRGHRLLANNPWANRDPEQE